VNLLAVALAASLPLAPWLDDWLGDWQPLAAEQVDTLPASAHVGPGGHATIQQAVDAAPAAGSSAQRHVITIAPGTYREPLCVQAKAPLLLRGVVGDAAAVRIVGARYNGLAKPVGTPAHPCVPALQAATHGTSGSTTAALFSDDAVLAHVSVANEATEPGGPAPLRGNGTQAVALTTAGDRILLHAVRLLGHQDTFYARRREAQGPARVLLRQSHVAGDVDFVFGNAALVVSHSTLHSRADRLGPDGGGIVLAPSTLAAEAQGFLVQHSRFTADAGFAPGRVALGRAWDQGVPPGQWQPGVSPNGQALVQGNVLGPHIGPWGASTSQRPPGVHGRLQARDNAVQP
jgi:pectinesterase